MDNNDVAEPLLELQQKSTLWNSSYKFWHACIAPFWSFWHTVHTFLSSAWLMLWDLLRKDPAKTMHAFKMALGLALAFLLVLLKAPYSIFGSHAIWAIMTVIVVFEFTVGATLSKGLNRGAGTLLAGLLAVIVGELAGLSKGAFHPTIVGISAFVIGAVVTFWKLWPSMKLYEYGLRTFLITFSYILVAEYQQDDPVSTAVNRFLIILLGAVIGVGVNIFVLPLWAGEELHQFVSKNFESLADALEACVRAYLRGTVLERCPTKILMGLAADDPVYRGYRMALISASKEESLASFASWEPPHGQFRGIKYPWHLYVKVGSILRHCAYSVVALHACLRSAIQAPLPVRSLFKDELYGLSQECAQVLRKLGKQVLHMRKGDSMNILNSVRKSSERLQHSLYLHSYLLVCPETGLLEENGMEELPLSVIPEIRKAGLAEDGSLFHGYSENKLGTPHVNECVNDEIGRQHYKKLYSWPYRPVDNFDFAKDLVLEQRVRVLESASALSLGTFATLLLEVALRLDYLVEAVDELAIGASFGEYKKVQDNGMSDAQEEVNEIMLLEEP